MIVSKHVRGVIICEIIVNLLVTVQNNERCACDLEDWDDPHEGNELFRI